MTILRFYDVFFLLCTEHIVLRLFLIMHCMYCVFVFRTLYMMSFINNFLFPFQDLTHVSDYRKSLNNRLSLLNIYSSFIDFFPLSSIRAHAMQRFASFFTSCLENYNIHIKSITD